MDEDREQMVERLTQALTARWTLEQVRKAHEVQVEAQLAYEAAHASAVLAYIRGNGTYSDAAAYAHATIAAADERRVLLEAEIEHEVARYGYVKAAPIEDGDETPVGGSDDR